MNKPKIMSQAVWDLISPSLPGESKMSDELLKVVGIEVPNGGLAMGTKVKLSNGQYLTGIQSITLHADTDSKMWSLNLKVMPTFVDQQTIEAVLANVELLQRESNPRLMHDIENQIIELQNKLNWLKDNEQSMS